VHWFIIVRFWKQDPELALMALKNIQATPTIEYVRLGGHLLRPTETIGQNPCVFGTHWMTIIM
jgi:hypothetical protein